MPRLPGLTNPINSGAAAAAPPQPRACQGPPRLPLDPPASGIIPPISAAKPGVPGLAHAGVHT